MCGPNWTVHPQRERWDEIDFMCLTMIDPASSWFEIVELPITTDVVIPLDKKGQKGTKTHNNTKLPYFDKSSAMISNLVIKTWFSRYPHCQYMMYDNTRKFKLHFKALCKYLGSSVSQPVSRTHKRMLYWSECTR